MAGLASWVLAVSLAGVGQAVEVTEPARREALEHYRAGVELMNEEAWARAEAEFLAAVDLDPLLVLAHYLLGQVYMAEHRYASAVRAYSTCGSVLEEIHRRESREWEVARHGLEEELVELERSAERRGGNLAGRQVAMRLATRVDRIKRIIRYDPGQAFETPPELLLAQGSAHFRMGNLEQAEASFLQAVRAEPGFGEAHNNLAVVYLMTGRSLEAALSVAEAEKSGFPVAEALKRDVAAARRGPPEP